MSIMLVMVLVGWMSLMSGTNLITDVKATQGGSCKGVLDLSERVCYSPGEGSKPWAEAEQDCLHQGGHLVEVLDVNTFNILNNLTNNLGWNEAWIGGSYIQHYSWKWLDGSPWNYTNWADGEPDKLDLETQDVEACAQIGTNVPAPGMRFKWYSVVCDKKQRFVCTLEKCSFGTSIRTTEFKVPNTEECYYINTDLQPNQMNALDMCKAEKGNLFSLNTAQKQENFEQLVNDDGAVFTDLKNSMPFWLGAKYLPDRHDMMWSSGANVTYWPPAGNRAKQDDSAPLTKRRQCFVHKCTNNGIEGRHSCTWHLEICSLPKQYICQTALHAIGPTTSGTKIPDKIGSPKATTSVPTTASIDMGESGQSDSPSDSTVTGIISGVVAVVVILAVVVVVVVCCRRKSRGKDTYKGVLYEDEPNVPNQSSTEQTPSEQKIELTHMARQPAAEDEPLYCLETVIDGSQIPERVTDQQIQPYETQPEYSKIPSKPEDYDYAYLHTQLPMAKPTEQLDHANTINHEIEYSLPDVVELVDNELYDQSSKDSNTVPQYSKVNKKSDSNKDEQGACNLVVNELYEGGPPT